MTGADATRLTAAAGGVVLLLGAQTGAAHPAHASGAAHRAPRPVARAGAFQVTGHPRSLTAYLRAGSTRRQAAALRQLDHLAAGGVDRALLTAASAGLSSGVASSSASSTPTATTFLEPVGDLDGVHGRDVLEERFLPGSAGTRVVQLLARDGQTGRVLWTRTDAASQSAFEVGTASVVGAHSTAGVLLEQDSFDDQGDDSTLLIALDGRGRQVWARRLTAPQPPEPSGPTDPTSGLGYDSFSETDDYLEEGVRLRPGAPDVVEVLLDEESTQDASGSSSSGSVSFRAVSTADGSVRALPGGTSSPDGFVDGGVVPDQDGDGDSDLATLDAGSAHRVTVTSAATSRTAWSSTDVPSGGDGYLEPAGPVSGAVVGTRRVEDLAVVSGPAASSDPTGLTAPAHGQVTLLAGGTGRTVLTETGDDGYPLRQAGGPAFGVATDESSASATTVAAKLQLDVYGADAAVRWSRTFEVDTPADPSSQDSGGLAEAFPEVDLDGDGGLEGEVFLEAYTDSSDVSADYLVRSRDGSSLRDTTSSLLGLGTTRDPGSDRYLVQSGKAGVVLRVLRGSDSHQRFAELVPQSAGTTAQQVVAVGARLGSGTSRCAQVLVSASGQSRAVVQVLTSAGLPLWSVPRGATDRRPGTVLLPRTAPAQRC